MIRLALSELKDSKKYICENSSIYFSCILMGKADGIIWGNRKESPEFLLVWCPYQEGFQLMGRPIPREEWKEFRSWFDNTIIPFLLEREMDYFEYGTDTQELADMFLEIFQDTNLLSSKQKIFRWHETELNSKQPAGYRIEKIDKEFFQKEYQNKEFVLDELRNAYGNTESGSEQGIFYVAIWENRVVARADMLFGDGKYGNISVNTEKEHRRKGLSAYLTRKTIEDTCELGLIPVWDCTDDNLASEKTAKKCGFRMIREDTIYWFNLNN